MADEVIKFAINAKDGASAAITKVNSAVAGVSSVMKKAALATAAAGTAVLSFTTVVANSIDKQAKFAGRLGISVEILSKYQFVANQAGISTDQFNLATQRMTRRVGEAAKGMGEAQGALRELGIDAESFKNLSVDKQMQTLADRMEGVSGESDKLRLAFKLFDSEGTAVLQMLKGGSEQMRKTAADAEFLGVAISARAAAQAELFTDKLGRSTAAMKGLSQSVAGEIMPLITGLADRFANFVATNRESITRFVSDTVTGFFTIGEVVGQAIDGIKRAFSDPKLFADFIAALGDLAKKVLVGSIAIGKVLVKGIWQGIVLVKDLFIGLGKWIGEAMAQIVLGETVTSPVEKFAEVFAESFANARTSMAGELDEMKGVLSQVLPDIGSSISETFGINLDLAREKAEKTLEGLSLFAQGIKDNVATSVEETLTLTDQISSRWQEFKLQLEQSSTQFVESLITTTQTAIDALSNGLANAMATGESGLEVFRSVAKQAVQQVIAALIKMGIQRLITSKTITSAEGSEAAAGASKAIGLAGANMFASVAGAPWPISLGAPAAAAGAMSGSSAIFSAGAALGASLGASVGAVGAVAHGGLTNNPTEVTAIIHKNERIISPEQNKDLTAFLTKANDDLDTGSGEVLASSTQPANSTVFNGDINVTLFPNASNIDGIRDINTEELSNTLSDAILMALNNLDSQGVRPNFVERENF